MVVFSSIDFIFKFFPVFFLIYMICPAQWKNLWIFAGSMYFYFYGAKDHPVHLLLFIASIIVNFFIGRKLSDLRSRKKKWLAAGIVYNFFWLILFKYAGFFVQNINRFLKWFHLPAEVPVFEAVLPIGISFYTFQAVSYLVDVYRKKTSGERSLVNFGMYISMFPQLIAGPIVTYSSIKEQIRKRRISWLKIEAGLREFTIGLGMKVLLANQIGGLWKNIEGIGFESISPLLAWLGLIAFSMQIYFDFYGYSLMAKGLGYMLGFTFPDNFSYPYISLSMTEFWRRWHITLGSWFREYVYIPLGGNRKGGLKTIRNLFVVWLLTGFWHGASWNFLLWGSALFVLILIEKAGIGEILEAHPGLGHLYMLFIIPLTWLLFAVADLSQITVYLGRLFPFLGNHGAANYFAGDCLKYASAYAVSLCAGIIFITPLPRNLYRRWKDSPATAFILLVVFWGCVYCMKMGLDDPFLYFRF